MRGRRGAVRPSAVRPRPAPFASAAHACAPLPCAQVPIWALLLLAGWFFALDEPPFPPSAGAAVQRARKAVRARATWQRSLAGCYSLLWDPHFEALNLSYATLSGLVALLATCVGQLFAPCGESAADAGAALALLNATAIVSVGIYMGE